MSEDIKDIEEILELAQEEIENNDENITVILDLQDLKSLRNLDNLYNKEKDLNNELQIRYKIEHEKYLKEKEKNKELNAQRLRDISSTKNYIHKDKIEEIANKRAETDGNYREAYYEILELLEERN